MGGLGLLGHPWIKRSICRKISSMRNTTRIGDVLGDLRDEEFSRISPSRNYRITFELDFNKKICDSFFFDRGREKGFKNYPSIQNELSDAFFEVILYDRKKDEVINQFLARIKRKYSKKWSRLLMELKRSPSSISQNALCELIAEVSTFFGGNDPSVLQRTRKVIREIQKKTGLKNIILLGQLKNNGVCRHRSLLFKIVCDLLNIRCKLVRGHFIIDKNTRRSHAWNVVQVSSDVFIIDCMNSAIPIAEAKFQHFREEVISENEKNRLSERTDIEKQYSNFFKSQFDPSGGGRGDQIKQKIHFSNDRTIIYQLTIKKDGHLFRKGTKIAVKVSRIEHVAKGKQNLHLIYAQKEASIIKSLNHDCIVGYYCSYLHEDHQSDDEEAEGESDYDEMEVKMNYFCLFLESMQTSGKLFLQNVIRKKLRGKPNQQAIESLIFLLQAARGLRYLHDLGYLHLDFKLSNILVSLNGTTTQVQSVKLIDFAGSKEKNIGLFSDTVISSTPEYRAPEVEEFIGKFKKKNVRSFDSSSSEGKLAKFPFDESVDIYSFGKVMLDFNDFLRFCPPFESLLEECILEKEVKQRPRLDYVIAMLRNILEYLDTEESEKMMKSKEREVEETKKKVDEIENMNVQLEELSKRCKELETKEEVMEKEIEIVRKEKERFHKILLRRDQQILEEQREHNKSLKKLEDFETTEKENLKSMYEDAVKRLQQNFVEQIMHERKEMKEERNKELSKFQQQKILLNGKLTQMRKHTDAITERLNKSRKRSENERMILTHENEILKQQLKEVTKREEGNRSRRKKKKKKKKRVDIGMVDDGSDTGIRTRDIDPVVEPSDPEPVRFDFSGLQKRYHDLRQLDVDDSRRETEEARKKAEMRKKKEDEKNTTERIDRELEAELDELRHALKAEFDDEEPIDFSSYIRDMEDLSIEDLCHPGGTKVEGQERIKSRKKVRKRRCKSWGVVRTKPTLNLLTRFETDRNRRFSF